MLFQSTPVIANGRIFRRLLSRHCITMFQSTPVIANGRIQDLEAQARAGIGFNPRPLLLTGESRFDRHPTGPHRAFQSTPVIANGRIPALFCAENFSFLFQSTPVIANGRIDYARHRSSPSAGFNPRPLLLTGESLIFRETDEYYEVSIHARYC